METVVSVFQILGFVAVILLILAVMLAIEMIHGGWGANEGYTGDFATCGACGKKDQVCGGLCQGCGSVIKREPDKE